jgi:hypothetical protein
MTAYHSRPFESKEAEQGSPLFWVTEWIPVHRSAIALTLSWMAPLFFMGIGYAFPPLREPLTFSFAMNGNIWPGLFVQLLFVFFWIIYEIWYATHRNTSIAQLQADAVGDIVVVLLLVIICATVVSNSGPRWWFIVPLLGSIIDVILCPVLGINNAAEKPFFSAKGST